MLQFHESLIALIYLYETINYLEIIHAQLNVLKSDMMNSIGNSSSNNSEQVP